MSWNKTHSKSLEEKVARIKSANQELREQLKAKDKKLQQLDEAYSKVASDFESAVMEIERLKVETKKTRSIVAMLFWEWKKAEQFTNSSLSQYDKGITEGMKYSFWKAYKMLKDNK